MASSNKNPPCGAAAAAPSSLEYYKESSGHPDCWTVWAEQINGTSWHARKLASLALATALRLLGLTVEAELVWNCCRQLEWHVYQHSDGTTDFAPVNLYSCKHRLCPLCSFLKSRKGLRRLKELFAKALELFPGLVPGHLVFTVPNVSGADLRATIEAMQAGWRRLYRRKEFKAAIAGTFRALEISFNAKTGLYHPHLHVLCFFVGDNYFRRSSGLYLTNDDWLNAWRDAVRIPDTQIVWTKTVKPNGDPSSPEAYADACEEVLGYVVKPEDVFPFDGAGFHCDPAVIGPLNTALRDFKRISTSGAFRKASAALKADNVAEWEEAGFWDEPIEPFHSGELLRREAYLWSGHGYEMLDGEHTEPHPHVSGSPIPWRHVYRQGMRKHGE